MLVAPYAGIRLFRQGIKRVFHLRDHVLEDRIRDIANKQVPLRMAIRQQLTIGFRGFSYRAVIFPICFLRVTKRFPLLNTTLNIYITLEDLWITSRFGISPTTHEKRHTYPSPSWLRPVRFAHPCGPVQGPHDNKEFASLTTLLSPLRPLRGNCSSAARLKKVSLPSASDNHLIFGLLRRPGVLH